MKQNDEIRFFKGLINGLGLSILLWLGILSAIFASLTDQYNH